MHTDSCMRAYATVQKLLCHGSYCELLLSLARASCRLSFATRPCCPSCCLNQTRRPTLFAQEIHPNPCQLMTVVSHKHDSIIRVGAGLIQFVSRSHLRFTSSRILFPLFFRVSFNTSPDFCRHNMRKGKRAKEKGPCSRLARV